MSAERWVPIPGYPDYEVSDAGRVRSHKKGGARILSTTAAPNDYPGVNVTGPDGVKRRKKVHSLVLLAFVGEPPEGMVCRHLNDVRSDNRLVNLAYGTQIENARDAVRNRRQWNVIKTHCIHGHEFNEANIIRRANGGRDCRECARANDERRRRRLGKKPRQFRNRAA